MNHPICDSCETVKHCSQHGCVPKQPLKPCRSPYCECVPGTCSHPGCYDARSEPFKHPAPVQEPDAIVTSLTSFPDGVVRSGLDRGLPLMAGVYLAPSAQPAPVPANSGLTNRYTAPEQLLALLQTASLGLDQVIKVFEMSTPAAQPAPVQEPYTVVRNAWTGKATYTCNTCGETDFRSEHAARFHICEPPAQPAQRPWVGLTDDELRNLCDEFWLYPRKLLQAIEAKLKEKNT